MNNKNKPITQNEYEYISRLIDNDLSKKEKETLLLAIKNDPELKREYNNLLKFKHLLSIVPVAKTRKSYRLTHGMVAIPSLFGIASKGWSIISQVSFLAMFVFMASQVLAPQNSAMQIAAPEIMGMAVAEFESADDIAEESVAEMLEPMMDSPSADMDAAVAEDAVIVEDFSVESDGVQVEGRNLDSDNPEEIELQNNSKMMTEENFENEVTPKSNYLWVENLRSLNVWVFGFVLLGVASLIVASKLKN
jgi:hypothetical protein